MHTFFYIVGFPLVCQILAYLDTFQSLIYPIIRKPQPFVVYHSLLYAELVVLHLVKTLCSNFGKPCFKGLRFWRWYRLNDAQKLFCVSNIR